ncbi:hypothetical protein ABZY26_000628 [Listeria monocytogenes]|uniref:CPCC family cysteine-rich protein n=1 Tax=Listeria monocytogenes TaxID=1639 RepID=UPI000874E854|nr:CPCC family cysteine-rich protein [Listeria monocytogenes]EII3193272.1 hypothetical protein [Listeria monocytogenes]EIQ6438114.1 hypothetical protein [Listeria monocytogenes]EIZ3606259.1 hypothetical protein [Listeria monocytogenes]EIZ6686099.1 hypothetical protein [Listeria monocytogenes]EKZ1696530.1 hypothetical protein [Listeria monocytogenes]
MPKHRCACCNSLTIEVRGEFEICQVCYWEDEAYSHYQNISTIEDLLNIRSSANNGLTLLEARQNFKQFGACELAMKQFVREPTEGEL